MSAIIMSMGSPESNFSNTSHHFEKEEEKQLTSEERLELVRTKYLSPEGYGNELFALCCIKTISPIITKLVGQKGYYDGAEDVIQIAALKASRTLRQFAGESRLSSWVLRIAINESFSFLRGMKARKDLSQKDSLDDIFLTTEDIGNFSAQEDAVNNVDLIENIFKTLNEHEKHILILHYVEGYSIAEMSAMLEISENTLKKQLDRTRKKASIFAKDKGWKL